MIHHSVNITFTDEDILCVTPHEDCASLHGYTSGDAHSCWGVRFRPRHIETLRKLIQALEGCAVEGREGKLTEGETK